MTEFTPLASTIGGMLIGLSAVLLMLFMGRIAGISGIASRLLPPVAGVALVAVGSLGRHEAVAHSDVDLVLLHDGKRKPAAGGKASR